MYRSGLVTLAVAIALASPAGAPAQEGGGFENLQVLPKDISRDDLRATMDGFADQLDVRCSYCHVRDDYPNDEKEHKQVARRMLKLVLFMRENTGEYFKEGINPQDINCWGCHRGKAEPERWVPVE